MKKISTTLLFSLFIIAGCSISSVAVSAPTVSTDYILESKTRVSRTVFDYNYKVSITNTESTEITNVKATATSSSADITITEGEVSFPDIAAGGTVQSSDTFTIRKDRNVAFDEDHLNWNVEFTNVNTVTLNSVVKDLDKQGDFIYALFDTYILKTSKVDLSTVQEIQLINMSSPEGLTLDEEGNIFVVDAGNSKVVKLLASSNYQEDQSFKIDSFGSGNGELLLPKDVSISGQGENAKIFVLDSGNNRVQIFNYVGAYLDSFDGSTTPEGKLSSPLNMIGAPNLIITDLGNKMIRKIVYNEISQSELGSKIISLDNFGKVTSSSNGIVLPDYENNKILFLKESTTINDIPLNTEDVIAIAYTNNSELAYSEGNNMKHIIINKTTLDQSPSSLSEKFVEYYIADNSIEMLNITNNNSVIISKLKGINSKVTSVFSEMESYKEAIYMNGLKAVVSGKSIVNGESVKVKFEYIWNEDKWVLIDVI